MQTPQNKFIKLVLNTSSKSVVRDKKFLIPLLAALELLSGRRPKRTYAKKSVANFQVRKRQCIGCKVTLRGNKMYQFLEKCRITLLPRLRDFQRFPSCSVGCQKSLNFGIDNILIFPELENHFELFEQVKGINISIAQTGWPAPFVGSSSASRSNNSRLLTYFV
ncbi:ribosomal protein L5 (mitochondrion) [Bryopsis sp. KO-2023]|nr:ribosomal protein L5 [Bryopsis sp. KO-2023]